MTIEELKAYRKAKRQTAGMGVPARIVWGLSIVVAIGICLEAFAQNFFLARFLPSIASNSLPAFSIVEISDLHAGSALITDFSNTVNSIIANKSNWNIKMVVSAGDLFEQTTNIYGWYGTSGGFGGGDFMTNQLYRLRAAGISVFPIQGNHDSDWIGVANVGNGVNTSIQYFTNVFKPEWVESDPYFYQCMTTDDSRNMAYRFTVGNFNMLILGLGWLDNYNTNGFNNPSFSNTNQTIVAYSNEVNWASNLIATMPTYHSIVVAHYIIGTNGLPGFKDLATSPDVPDPNTPMAGSQYVCEGPGLELWNVVNPLPNLIALINGHVRASSQVVNSLTAGDGHLVAACKLNTQTGLGNDPSIVANNGGVFSVYTFYPSTRVCLVKNYGYVNPTSLGSWTNRFLNSNEFQVASKALFNSWSFNFK